MTITSPFSDNINLRTISNELSEIIIYDASSRKILQEQFAVSVSLNAGQLTHGIYIYEFEK